MSRKMSSASSSISGAPQKEKNGFSNIISEKHFKDKFPAVTIVECNLSPSVKLDDDAFECFLTYIDHSLDLDENFINSENEKGKYFFYFILLSFIASCAKGISASEAAVGKNENSTSSLKMGVESNIQVQDGGIVINHEIALKCSKPDSPRGPVEFTTFTRIPNVCRSVLEVKGDNGIGEFKKWKYQLFAQLVVAMEKNMELTPPVEDPILGAFAPGDFVLLSKIDMDSTKGNFRIFHTQLYRFRQQGGKIKVFDAEYSKL
eukprot:gene7735-10451_t